MHHAGAVWAGEDTERRGDEIIERKEKGLHARENYADVRHQLRMALAIQEKNQERVNREQPGPEEQRAFLTGPERGKFIEAGEGAIAVFDYVHDGKIVGEEKIFQAADGDRHQDEH